MARQASRSRFLRGCLPFVLAIAAIVGGISAWITWRMGGIDGFERKVLISGAVSGVERQVLSQRPDGVAEIEVETTFEAVRDAALDARIDRARLYDVLRDYQRRFKGTHKKPSDQDVRQLLSDLEESILHEATSRSAS